MKQIVKIYILSLIIICIPYTSCSDYLDKAPEEDITIEEAFLQRNYAEAFLTDVYADVPFEIFFTDGNENNPFVLASDELNVPWPEKFGKIMNRGALNPYNTTGYTWIIMYEGIRKANIFLNNIHLTPTDNVFTETDKNRWIGEAILLRAFYHFYLIRIYGPVIIMEDAVNVDDDFTQIRRQPLDDCIQFVVNECDKAIPLLGMHVVNNQQLGRVTAALAYAIKARLLLYRASPLYNGNPDYVNIKDNNGASLFPQQYERERWSTAATAIKECIDKCEAAGYALYRAGSNDPVENYTELFLNRNNSEVIWARNCGVMGYPEQHSFPLSLGGWSGLNPTHNLIDAYEMDNGEIPISGYRSDASVIINPTSGYTESGFAATDGPNKRWVAGVSNMYVNRDPRFYATVNFNGAIFKNHQFQFWKTGVDGRKEGRDYATTGYLLKKGVDPAVDVVQSKFSLKTWILFRLGEQYLNYAEALNEANDTPPADVYSYINAIRDRAGMPPLPTGLNQKQMRERIWRERQVELAFETHRYFDCHRWKIAQNTDNGPIYGMNIEAGTNLQDPEFYKRMIVEKRIFRTPTHYLFPIYQSEIDKNPNLMQNPGW